MPAPAMTRNQSAVTGPKKRPTAPVPCDWMANRQTRIVTEIGTIYCVMVGATSFNPSTAESTDSAGVIITSPRKSAAPIRPSSISSAAWPFAVFISSASSDNVPPSPSLSARSRNSTYLTVTMTVSDQIIIEIRLMISNWVSPSCEIGLSASRKA